MRKILLLIPLVLSFHLVSSMNIYGPLQTMLSGDIFRGFMQIFNIIPYAPTTIYAIFFLTWMAMIYMKSQDPSLPIIVMAIIGGFMFQFIPVGIAWLPYLMFLIAISVAIYKLVFKGG